MTDYKVTKLDAAPDVDHLPYWDVVIIGAGPAGLAASLTTAHRGLTTLVVEAKDRPGGQPHFLYPDKQIVDVPAFPDGITGEELSARTLCQAAEALVQFRFAEELLTIEDTDRVEEDPLKRVVTNKSSYLCRKVILACGLLHYPRRLPILDRLSSPRVHYRIPRIDNYQRSRILVVGGGDSALDAALMILARGGQVELVVRGQTLAGRADALARSARSGWHCPHFHGSHQRRVGRRADSYIAQQWDVPVHPPRDRPNWLSIGEGDFPTAGDTLERRRKCRHRSVL